MNINGVTVLETDSIADNLKIYLSEVLLTETDEKIKKENDSLVKDKRKLSVSKELLKRKKEEISSLELKYARERQLEILLKLISKLLQEGSLVGQNRTKVSRILEEIEEKDYDSLRNLEQKLSILRSEN